MSSISGSAGASKKRPHLFLSSVLTMQNVYKVLREGNKYKKKVNKKAKITIRDKLWKNHKLKS